MLAYFASLDPLALLRACPGGIAQGLIWGIMALGVYFTFRILDIADLSVDGSFATGGAVSMDMVDGIVTLVNGRFFKGIAKMIKG